jgi:hypothetical protein
MFITKKHIARRTFLRGMGVTMALPWLEAMAPAQTPLSQIAQKPRFVGIWHPHGAAVGYWSPEQVGKDFKFSFITEPLEPFRDQVVLISNLDATSSQPTNEEPGGDHQRGAAIFTGARPRVNAVIPYVGVSIDQLIARKHGQENLLPSMQIGIEDPGTNTGVCNFGYSCAYTNSVSWATPTQPLPHIINPLVVFENLFGSGGTTEERVRGRETDRSILDAITREVAPLRNKVGAEDKSRLDSYLTDVREIERRLQVAAKASAETPSTDVPFGVPTSFDEHVKLMWDLTALAFQGDMTRVCTMMYGRDVTARTFPESGFDGPWHGSSHHDDVPERVKNYSKMNRYHVSLTAYLVKKLRDIKEADGTVLDHTLVYQGSNMGNSNRHAHERVPVILVGGLNGKMKGNYHYMYKEGEQRTSNLLLSLLEKYDIQRDTLGDSTGQLDIA